MTMSIYRARKKYGSDKSDPYAKQMQKKFLTF